jgi:hypothetical protein
MSSRRLFLKSLFGASAASVAYCFMPSIPLIGEGTSLVTGGSALVTPTWVTREVAKSFMNNIAFIKHVNRTYDDIYIHLK